MNGPGARCPDLTSRTQVLFAAAITALLSSLGACGGRSSLEAFDVDLSSGTGGAGAGGPGSATSGSATSASSTAVSSSVSSSTTGGGPCALGDGAPCDDGDACTLTDVCKNGVCVGQDAIVCPPVGACQSSTCVPQSGVCVVNDLPNGAACDDGDMCSVDACSAGVCVGTLLQSQVLFETRPWTSADGVANSAASALAIWNSLPSGVPGYGSGTFPSAESLATGVWGSSTDAASHFQIVLFVHPADAGTWEIRIGPDYGFGGVLLLDNAVIDEDWGDLWWAGNWGAVGDLLQSGPITLASGWHTLDAYGFEECCGGSMTIQFKKPGDGWLTAAASDFTCP